MKTFVKILFWFSCWFMAAWVNSAVYAAAYFCGIQLFAKEFGYTLPELNAWLFFILSIVIAMLKTTVVKDSERVDLFTEEGGKRYCSIILTKLVWIAILVATYLIYNYV